MCIISATDLLRLDNKVRSFLFFASNVILLFFITVRFGDPDYENYSKLFSEISIYNFNSNQFDGEIGYRVLNALIKTFSSNPLFFFFFLGLLTLCFTSAFFKKYSKFYLISLLIYFSHAFLLREMTQIRSGLAISICMFSIQYVQRRKFWNFSLIILLAFSIHYIALSFFLVYFLHPFLNSKSKRYGIILIGLLLGVLLNISTVSLILEKLGLSSIIINYIEDDAYNYSLGVFNPVIIKSIIFLFFLIKYTDYLNKHIRDFNALLTTYIFGVFWLLTFNSVAIIGARVGTLFINVEHVLIPSLLLINRIKYPIFFIILFYAILAFLSKNSMLQGWTINPEIF